MIIVVISLFNLNLDGHTKSLLLNYKIVCKNTIFVEEFWFAGIKYKANAQKNPLVNLRGAI